MSEHESGMQAFDVVIGRLSNTPGVVACWILPDEERESLRQLELESNHSTMFHGMEVVNEGIEDVLERGRVVVMLHSPLLRHPSEPIVLICDEEGIVGEEVWDTGRREQLSRDPNVIFLGNNLILRRDALLRSRGRILKLTFRSLKFPELEGLRGVRDVVSVTVGSQSHRYLVKKAGWGVYGQEFGIVLIGFNASSREDLAGHAK
jgi:hypothetical protein